MTYVTRADCARADAAALASDFSGRRILDVTGPAPITPSELARLASKISGQAAEVSAAVAGRAREDAGRSRAAAVPRDALADFDEAQSHGHLAIRSPAVQALTGKAPQSVADFLTSQRAALTPA